MASQMVVPASKDTLFMRGFSARKDIEDIREFFNQHGGSRCTVEFFKESDDKSKLYLALRFDSKDVAKELLNKYDNTDVLGDRITISWFKDLRRARMKAGNRGRRSNWSPERYNDYRKDRYHGGGGRYSYGQYGSRRRFDRSSSRSRSRSSSRSPSRSVSPRRSRTRSKSNDSHSGSKHKRSRTSSDSRKDRRKRSTEKEKSRDRRDRVSRDRSVSITRRDDSQSRDEDEEESPIKADPRLSVEHSPASRGSKVIRSTVTTVDRGPAEEPISDDESDDEPSRETRARPNNHTQEPVSKRIVESHSYKDERELPTPDGKLDHRETPSLKDGPDGIRGRSSFANSQERNKPDTAPFEPPLKDRDMRQREVDTKDNEPEEQFYHRRPPSRYDRDMSPPTPTERQPQNPRFAEKPFNREQDFSRTYDRMRRSVSPLARSDGSLHQTRDVDARKLPPGNDYTESPQHMREREVPFGYRPPRDIRNEGRYSELPRDLPVSSPPQMTGRGRPMAVADPRDIRSSPVMEPEMSPDTHVRGKRMYDDDMPMYERKNIRDRDYDEMRVLAVRRETDDLIEAKRRRYIEESSVAPREMRREYFDERPRLERPAQGANPGARIHLGAERDRSPFFDDRASTGTASSRNIGAQSFNGNISREAEKGALGLPMDKMALVREKKDEIEKSYRQDCETFAAVTKMLISKDGSLEEKLQGSLRENLKDIGQRCIHELREFIDRLKGEDERRHLH